MCDQKKGRIATPSINSKNSKKAKQAYSSVDLIGLSALLELEVVGEVNMSLISGQRVVNRAICSCVQLAGSESRRSGMVIPSL